LETGIGFPDYPLAAKINRGGPDFRPEHWPPILQPSKMSFSLYL
jgi:hypothetical protein